MSGKGLQAKGSFGVRGTAGGNPYFCSKLFRKLNVRIGSNGGKMDNQLRLRELIQQGRTVVAPGVYDCVSAKIVEKLGFEVAFVSGYGLEASVLGNPDIGLASKTDVITHARYIARSVEIPVICDADNGFGNVLNVWDAVRGFEEAGVAGVEIEDQTLPKKCGYLPYRKVISMEEMQNKIEAARDARRDESFLIIGRSDARGVAGVDEAIRRYNAYFEAGADMVVIAEPYEIDEMKKAAGAIQGPLGVAGGIPGRSETLLALEEYEKMGITMVIFGLAALYAAARAILDIYADLKKNGSIPTQIRKSKMVGFEEFNELIGLQQWIEIQKKYLRT